MLCKLHVTQYLKFLRFVTRFVAHVLEKLEHYAALRDEVETRPKLDLLFLTRWFIINITHDCITQ